MKLIKKWTDLGWEEEANSKLPCFKRRLPNRSQQMVIQASWNKKLWRAVENNYSQPVPFIGDIHFPTMTKALQFFEDVAVGKAKWRLQ